MNRRDFLRGGTIAATAMPLAGFCASKTATGGAEVAAADWLFTDVVVAGGGPAGVCAAVSAARAGAKVVLAERFGCLGGNLTLGHVSPILGKVCPGTMVDEVLRLLSAGELIRARRQAHELAQSPLEQPLCSNACLVALALEAEGEVRKRRMAKRPAIQITQAKLLSGSSWLRMT